MRRETCDGWGADNVDNVDDEDTFTHHEWVTYTHKRGVELSIEEATFLASHRASNYLAILVVAYVVIPIIVIVALNTSH
jgi:hypothetical protein